MRDAGNKASDEDVAKAAFKSLAVAFGRKILEIVPGRVSTEVDARLSYDTEGSIAAAHDIIAQYNAGGPGGFWPNGVTYSYGDNGVTSNVYVGNLVATPSLTFYPAGSTSGGASRA